MIVIFLHVRHGGTTPGTSERPYKPLSTIWQISPYDFVLISQGNNCRTSIKHIIKDLHHVSWPKYAFYPS